MFIEYLRNSLIKYVGQYNTQRAHGDNLFHVYILKKNSDGKISFANANQLEFSLRN